MSGKKIEKINFGVHYLCSYLKSSNSKNNPYFNKTDYLKKYPDVEKFKYGPVTHYLLHGMNEGRTDYYDKNVKEHELVKKSGLFNYTYYSQVTGITFNSMDQAIFHYLETGYKQGCNPSKKFDGNTYLKKYPDVKEAGLNPLVHYLKYGKNEEKTDKCDDNLKEYKLVKKSGLYDHKYYTKQYKGFKSPRHGLINYLEFGYKHGYNPSKKFNGNNYLKKYPNVEKIGMNPLVHYLKYGKKEGKTDNLTKNQKEYELVEESELYDHDYYTKQCKINFITPTQGLLHYLKYGHEQEYNPSQEFDGNIYLKKYPDVKEAGLNPLVHYLKYGKNEEKTDKLSKNQKAYEIVEKSGLYDHEYYTNQSRTNFITPTQGLLHYLKYGYKKGHNPSKEFNGNIYLKKYPDVKEAGLNPLVHYLKYGKNEEKTDKCDKNIREYKLVEESGLYNHEYYSEQVHKGFGSPRHGLLHYLEHGFKQGYNPSKYFDGEAYFNRYPDVKNSSLNPLVHYLKYGIKEERIGLKEIEFKNLNDTYNIEKIIEQLTKKVTVITIADNIKYLNDCIRNLIKYNKTEFEIIIINQKYDNISNYIPFNNIKIINIENTIHKLINTLKMIIKKTDDDILFIKNNVITYEKFLMKLAIAAYSNERTGIVIPISNYSSISLTEDLDNNHILINNVSKKEYNETPIPNTTCMYIKNKLLKKTPLEEDEKWLEQLCSKAVYDGWKSVFDDSTFVNYQQLKNNQKQDDEFALVDPYNSENQPTVTFLNSQAYCNSNKSVQSYLNHENQDNYSKKRVLYVMHYSGGVEFAVKDIAKSVSGEYDCYILKAYKNKFILYHLSEEIFIPIQEFDLKYPWHSTLLHSEEYKQIYFYILANLNIDIVEIDHLLFHTFDIIDVAEILNIPTIITIHDYYYICPTFILLDENNKYCGGYCENNGKNCSKRVKWFNLPMNITEWKIEWQKQMLEIFKRCDSILTATSFTKNMILNHYPDLNTEDIQLIEHGRDLIKYDNFSIIPNSYQPVKILIPGTLSVHKGSEFVKELKKVDVENKLELHFLGGVTDEIKKIGIAHGKYKREEFSKHVYKIKPSFIGIFSIWPETYSYTLTESLSAGIPIIGSNMGALKERIEDYDCGWLIDINKPEEAYEKILKIASDKKEYKRVRKQINGLKIRNTKQMGEEYLELYKKLLKE